MHRFDKISELSNLGLALIPENMAMWLDEAAVASLATHFAEGLPDPSTFCEEVERWRLLWESEAMKPCSIESTLKSRRVLVRKECYPNILRILKLLLLLPVTSASVERANSALGFVKSARRNAMTQDRLNALLLLFCHKDICNSINLDNVIDRFANHKPRRMLLSPLCE